jgi:biopolymer transport protein ExbD
VLLIIMMLVAPLLQEGVRINKPEAQNTTDKPDTGDPTVVFVDAFSQYYINALPVTQAEIAGRLTEVLEGKAERTVFLKGDKDAPYSAIMVMMDALRAAQIETVGLITERPGGSVTASEGGNQ